MVPLCCYPLAMTYQTSGHKVILYTSFIKGDSCSYRHMTHYRNACTI